MHTPMTIAAAAMTIAAWTWTIHSLTGLALWAAALGLWGWLARAAWYGCCALSRRGRRRCATGLVCVALAAAGVTFGEPIVVPTMRWLAGLSTAHLMAIVGGLAGVLVLVGVREFLAGARDRPGLLERIDAIEAQQWKQT